MQNEPFNVKNISFDAYAFDTIVFSKVDQLTVWLIQKDLRNVFVSNTPRNQIFWNIIVQCRFNFDAEHNTVFLG